jgi:hypothetical protein
MSIQTEVSFKVSDLIIALESNMIAVSEEKSRLANLNKDRRTKLALKFPLCSKVVLEYLTHNMSGAGIDDLLYCTNAKTADRSLEFAKSMIDKTQCASLKNVRKVMNSLNALCKNDAMQADNAKGATWSEVHKGSYISAEMMFKSYLRVCMQHGLIARSDGGTFNDDLKVGDKVFAL